METKTIATLAAWERLWLHGLILVMLGLAFVEWDEYGFYVLLRFVCCVTFGRWAFLAFEKDGVKWGWLWGVLAAGYNPFFPLSLGRDVWEWVNAGTMIAVLVDSWLAVRASPTKRSQRLVDELSWFSRGQHPRNKTRRFGSPEQEG